MLRLSGHGQFNIQPFRIFLDNQTTTKTRLKLSTGMLINKAL